jgi:hypothetical protein
MITMEIRIYLPNKKALEEEVLKKAHKSKFVVHPSIMKIYKDLKESYW